jgi:chromate transporter
MSPALEPPKPATRRGPALEVFKTALSLGLTSFGGPIAHLGYFERTYVRRLRWITTEDYASLVALCQMLPGPASSQVGFLIGLRRAGWPGALAAWLGFTLPSAIALFAFALAAPALRGPLVQTALHGLKLVAVAVVAQAVWNMARNLCPDRTRAALALGSAILLLLYGGAATQVAALALGAAGGLLLLRRDDVPLASFESPVGPRAGLAALGLFAGLLFLLPVAGHLAPHSLVDFAAIFYRAGALVFGGGHLVLPLLRDALTPSGWLTDDAFLAGYGAAQAVPGPLFTFAAYLGAAAAPSTGLMTAAAWAFTALVFAFLPGLLLAAAGARLGTWIGTRPFARTALAGVNAAVVGVLGAALYNPIWTSAVGDGRDAAIALSGFVLLERWRLPPLAVTAFCIGSALLTHAMN